MEKKVLTVTLRAETMTWFLWGFWWQPQTRDICKGCSWVEINRNRNPHPLPKPLSFGNATNCGLFIVTSRNNNTSVGSEDFRKDQKISLPLSPQALFLSAFFFLSVLLPSVDQRKISFCLRNHPCLSQSNYKPGYFSLSAKHFADRYSMTLHSHLFYQKIPVKVHWYHSEIAWGTSLRHFLWS